MAKGAGVTAEKVVKDIRRKTRQRFSALVRVARGDNAPTSKPSQGVDDHARIA